MVAIDPEIQEINLPYNFTPRDYQMGYCQALAQGFDRTARVWHRRAGKDILTVNMRVIPSMLDRVANYAYYFPTQKLGRDALWECVTSDGRRMLDYFPPNSVARVDNQSMKIWTVNGSSLQISGTETGIVVAVNPAGAVFSEYSLINPKQWEYISPILIANGGWADFLWTPRGKNHAWILDQIARKNPDVWWYQKQTIDDTKAVTIDQIRRDGTMSEEMIQQEYFCSYEVGSVGSIYSRLIADLYRKQRICSVPYDPTQLVYTFWDIGIGDLTSIWFWQFVGKEIHVIDYYEASGEGLRHYADKLKEKSDLGGYRYARHVGPHDMNHRIQDAVGQTKKEIAAQLGLDFDIIKPTRVEDGIETVRGVLPLCWIDSVKCADGLAALESYHYEYLERKSASTRIAYANVPFHDWSSHASDAFRQGALWYRGNSESVGSSVPGANDNINVERLIKLARGMEVHAIA
jgi:phage terminase large subunit